MTTNYAYDSPTVIDSLATGWKKMMGQFLPLFLIIIICAVLQGPTGILKGNEHFDFFRLILFPLFLAYGFLFWPVISFGADFLYLKAIRDEKVEVTELLDGFRTRYVRIILANLIKIALIIMGFILLIIPGIIICCRLAFVSYLVMDRKLEPMDAVEQSWRMTRGYGWTIFFLGISSVFIFIAGLLALIVGVFVSFMWIKSSFAALYQSVTDYRTATEVLPILGVNEM